MNTMRCKSWTCRDRPSASNLGKVSIPINEFLSIKDWPVNDLGLFIWCWASCTRSKTSALPGSKGRFVFPSRIAHVLSESVWPSYLPARVRSASLTSRSWGIWKACIWESKYTYVWQIRVVPKNQLVWWTVTQCIAQKRFSVVWCSIKGQQCWCNPGAFVITRVIFITPKYLSDWLIISFRYGTNVEI